jgi:hypothetical protein
MNKLIALIAFASALHMRRSILLRALLVASITALAVLPAGALAAKPELFHDNFSFTEEDVDFCGVTVDVAGEGVFTIRNFFDEEGNFTRFLLTQSDKIAYTAANGKSVIVQHIGQQIAPPGVVDETAGTFTTLFTFKGVPAKLQTANGPVLLRDVGLVTFSATFDLDTDELIAFEVLVVKGPHPDLESDFTLFCEVVTDALA